MASEAMIISWVRIVGQRVDGPFDQPRAVVEGHDAHALGQPGLKLHDLLLDPLGDGQRVLAVAHHHHRADGFVAVLFQHAAAELAAPADRGQIRHVDGRAASRIDLDDDVLDVAERANPADAADQIFGVAFLDHAAADGGVRSGDGGVQFAERDAVGAEFVRIDVDLVFDRKAAHRGDLGHAGHGIELIADVPVLDGPEPAEVVAVALDGVPEDLPQGRGVGGQVRESRPAAGTCWPG